MGKSRIDGLDLDFETDEMFFAYGWGGYTRVKIPFCFKNSASTPPFGLVESTKFFASIEEKLRCRFCYEKVHGEDDVTNKWIKKNQALVPYTLWLK